MTDKMQKHWIAMSPWTQRSIIFSVVLFACTVIAVIAADSDNDGMTDSYEDFYGLDTSSNDSTLNPDGDSLPNLAESYTDTDPFTADTDRDGFLDGADSNALSRAYVPLGDEFWTDVDDCFYGWPNWMISAYKMDGSWNTNPPSWYVSNAESNGIGIINFDLNRSIITNNIVMALNLHDTANSVLYLDLAGTNGSVINTNLLGNLLSGANEDTTLTFNIPLTNNPDASTICLRRGTGEITLYSALLYMDADLDRLDDQQEDQLGTDPDLSDTDGDGLSDYTEVFVTHTDPLVADSDGDGLSDGAEVNTHGTNPLQADTDNDGLNDAEEINTWGTNPNNPDSDGDGLTDGAEVAFGRNPNLFDAYSYLVFQEQFETNTVALGELNGQHNWTVSVTNAALIQTNLVYDGNQSLLINNSDNSTTSVVSQMVIATNDLQVWFDLVIAPEDAPEPTAAPTGIAAMYFKSRQLVIYDGTSETWITLTNHPPVATDWARLSIMADFETQRWLVALDGTLVATEIGFASYTTYASVLSIEGNKGAADNITIGREMPGDLDLDNDGLTAAEELAAGSDPFSTDSDGDGMGDAAELRWGFSASETNTYFRLDVDSGHDTWATGFEPGEGYQTGDLAGQNSWLASSNVTVSASNSYSGIQSVSIPESGSTNLLSMKGRFGTHGRERIWVSMYLQPSMHPPQAPTTNSACVMAIYDDRVYAYDGELEDWMKSDKVSPIGSNEWVRIDILVDYNTKMYLVCLNGVLALENVQFGDISIEELTSLSISGSDEAGSTWIDDIMLSVQEPAGALDFDADGLSNADEYTAGTDARIPDTDGDGVTDLAEINIFNTDPLNSDSDSDGIPDGWEIANGLDPLSDESSADTDNDGLTNLEEFQYGTNPQNSDTDEDGLTDYAEINTHGTNPLAADTDSDGLNDGSEINTHSTDPLVVDTDSDTLSDYDEVTTHDTDPTLWDTDGEALSDAEELQIYLTNPLLQDSNTNGILDATLIGEKNGADSSDRQSAHITNPWFTVGNSAVNYKQGVSIYYTFDVTTAGMHRVGLQLSNYATVAPVGYMFNVQLRVNGIYVGTYSIAADLNQSGEGFLVSPWLSTGTHTMQLTWVNDSGGSTAIQIEKLKLWSIDGADDNTNGIQDWMESRITGDSDGDGISDLDEISQYGSSPVLTDTDMDGLSDYEEITNLGTDPTSVDSDQDGVGDAEELFSAHTDPLSADFNGQQTILAVINGSAYTNSFGYWIPENGSAVCLGRGEYVDYSLPVSSNGHFAVELMIAQHNTWSLENAFDISIAVDGIHVARQMITVNSTRSGSQHFFLPYLSQGNHSVRVTWHNPLGSSILSISSLTLKSFGGNDTDQNGQADWLDSRLALALEVDMPTSRLVSPICIEGHSWAIDSVNANASYMPDDIEQQINVQTGLADLWYANILLSPTNSTTIDVSANNQQETWTTNIVWQSFNTFDPTLATGTIIRENDSLLLAGLPSGETNGATTLTLILDTQTITNLYLTPGLSVPQMFTTAGQYLIEAAWSNSVSNITTTASVEVVSGKFASVPSCMVGWNRTWDCPDMPSAKASIEYDNDLIVSKSTLTGGGLHFNLKTYTVATYNMLARLGAGGTILDSTEIRTLRFDTSAYGSIDIIESYADGTELVEVEMWFSEIPENLRFIINIFAGGVVFDDGTTYRVVTAADFDEMGRYRYRILRGANVTWSTCHRKYIYDGDTKIAF